MPATKYFPMIDFAERGLRFAGKAPDAVTADALARVRVLVDD